MPASNDAPRKNRFAKQPKPKRVIGGDAATGGKKQIETANAYKKTPTYRASVRKSYDSTGPTQRKRRLDVAKARTKAGTALPEDKIVQKTHAERHAVAKRRLAAGRIGAGKDIKSDADFSIAASANDARDQAKHDIILNTDLALGHDIARRDRWAFAEKTRREATTIGKTGGGTFGPKAKHKASDIYETDPAKLEAAGFKPEHDGIFNVGKAGLGALASGFAVGEATLHDPLGVPTKTAKQALDAIPALPGQVVDLATHPIKTTKAMAKDFAKRGNEPYADKVKTIRKEGGLAYGSDAALVLGPIGATGRLGLKVARHDIKRAAVRTSGGAAKSRPQRGFARDSLGAAMDNSKAAKHERRLAAAEAGGAPVDALVREAAEANRRAGRVVEVVGRKAGRRQVQAVAKAKGHGHYGFKRDQGVRLGAAKKLINQLDKHEKRAFYYAALGIRTPEQAAELLPNLRKKIVATRKAEGIAVKGSLKKSDMLPDIDAILADPLKHFTPKLAEIVDALAPDARRAGHEDPSFDAGIERGRRHAPLADLFDMERGVNDAPVPTVKPKVTLADVQAAAPAKRSPTYRSPTRAEFAEDYRKAAEETGLPAKEVEKLDNERMSLLNKDTASAADAKRIVEINNTIPSIRHSIRVDSPAERRAMIAGTADSGERRRAQDARARFEEAGPNAAARAQGQAIVAGALREVPAEHRTPGHRYFDETDAGFVDRLAAEAKGRGMAEPLYFKSERYVGPRDFASRALGGIKAAATDQHYKGVNLRQGLQDTSPDQFLRGNARSIKRKHNWELVAGIADKNVIRSLSRDGSTVSAIRERAAKDGVDPGSYALWNPGVMRRFAEHQAGDQTDERFVQPEEFDMAAVDAGLKHSTVRVNDHGQAVDGTGALVDAGELAKTNGWVAVPDGVLKELEAQMVPSGPYARSWDIAKGKASRAMLLTGNVPWLGFQVASNLAMGAAATGGRILNPANWVHAWKDWHNLTPEEQQGVGSILGLDATSADSAQRKLGATTNNDFINAYRAMKAHPLWHTGVAGGRGPSVSELNPLELMARADRGQNNIFRHVAGYSLAKRDAVRRMGENMGVADKLQLKIVSVLKMPPEDALRALRHDPEMLERHGDAIADWMGDYSTMTSNERKVLGRAIMFYPYIRYSLKLLFYTLPVKHPAVTAVLAEMGNMKAEELKKLLGEDSLPFNIGKIYFGKDGNVKSIDLRRANPALNAVIDAARNRSLSQAIGIMPPYVAWLTNQAYGMDSFTGKAYKVQGKAADYGQRLPVGAVDVRGRILANDVLSLLYPNRVLQHMHINPTTMRKDDRLVGTQGDDSLVFSPRPTHFKGDTVKGKLQAKFAARREAFNAEHDSFLHELIPLLPTADRSKAETRENKILAKASKPKHKKPRKIGGDTVKPPRFGKSKAKGAGSIF